MPIFTMVKALVWEDRVDGAVYLLSRSRIRPPSYRDVLTPVDHAEDADAAAGMLDDREDVHPGPGQRHRLDEVRGQQRLGLRA